MQHTAMVPKGFVRYQVLECLGEKSMSGSEIINEIESKTHGRWKPSPGSIYPLLAWLQDNGHIKELPAGQSGMKRYELTSSGKALLEEQRKIIAEQRKKMKEYAKNHLSFGKERFFGPPLPPFVGAFLAGLPEEKLVEVKKTMRRLGAAVFELGHNLEEHMSEEAFDESLKLLNNTAEKLEEISDKLKGEKDE
ncbi:MAG TPA: PadR family transcriptional regulator [Candidatus Bathyarchaeia archaeon]|nr:PadR family transcriptional regulator [Candidatus Bathyarchaeia archaeon]